MKTTSKYVKINKLKGGAVFEYDESFYMLVDSDSCYLLGSVQEREYGVY